MYRRVLAVLLLVFASAVMGAVPGAMAKPGNGNGDPTCPGGGSPPCGNPGGGGGYQPQPIIEIDCLKIFGDLRDGDIPALLIDGNIRLLSPPGCLIGGRLVLIVILSEPHVIGQGRVLEDGSVQIEGKVPANISAGTHNLSVRVEGRPEIVRAIELVPSLDDAKPASGSGESASNSAMLALWALLIVGGGAVLASVGWRRVRARPAAAGTFAALRRRRSEALAPTVPHIDTSDFVPMKPADSSSGPEEIKD